MPAAAGAAASSSAGDNPAGGGTIVIKNFVFSPATLSVSPGTVVMVHNEDPVTQTLTDKADPELFGTGEIRPGQSGTLKAPGRAGSYLYICTIRQYMTGILVVR